MIASPPVHQFRSGLPLPRKAYLLARLIPGHENDAMLSLAEMPLRLDQERLSSDWDLIVSVVASSQQEWLWAQGAIRTTPGVREIRVLTGVVAPTFSRGVA